MVLHCVHSRPPAGRKRPHPHTHTPERPGRTDHVPVQVQRSPSNCSSQGPEINIHSLILELLFSLQMRQLSFVAVKTACSAVRLPTFKSGIPQLLLGDLEQMISQCFSFIACKTWEVTGTVWVSNELVCSSAQSSAWNIISA